MHLLSGAYAVDALDPAEREEFEAHLAQCPDCAAEVRGLLDTAARLGSAEAVTPPTRLKASVLAQIATTRQLSPAGGAISAISAGTTDPAGTAGTTDPAGTAGTTDPAGTAGTAADAAHAEDERPGADSVVVRIGRPGWSWAQRSLAVAAAFLAVVAIGLSALLVQADNARNQVDATQRAVTRVLTAADARSLTGSLTAGGKATIVVSPSQGTSVFLGTGLPEAPAGHTYELWYMGGATGSAVPAGTFDPDATGHVAAVLTGPIGSASAIGVTVEPAGGSAAPTTKPVLALRLPA
jgi:anti-sigma-K factor RskA